MAQKPVKNTFFLPVIETKQKTIYFKYHEVIQKYVSLHQVTKDQRKSTNKWMLECQNWKNMCEQTGQIWFISPFWAQKNPGVFYETLLMNSWIVPVTSGHNDTRISAGEQPTANHPPPTTSSPSAASCLSSALMSYWPPADV